MTRFLDGPAAGETLSLTRAPIMLRAVKGPKGWDALDQLEDEPKANEAVTVYILVSEPRVMFIDGCTKGGGRRVGWREVGGDYRALAEQPGDAHTRTDAAWIAWIEANKPRLLELHKQLMGAPKA